MSDRKQPLTVYYDGACPDCVEDRERYERWAADDANVHWYDITGKDEALRERGIDPERAGLRSAPADVSAETELTPHVLNWPQIRPDTSLLAVFFRVPKPAGSYSLNLLTSVLIRLNLKLPAHRTQCHRHGF